jgi:glycosyltransferase involved in cell wall biosynthesis
LADSGQDVVIIDTKLSFEGFDGVGRLSFKKIIKMILVYIKFILSVVKTKDVYMTPGMSFYGFLSFFPFVIISKLLGRKLYFHYHGFRLFKTFSEAGWIFRSVTRIIIALVNEHIFLSDSHAELAKCKFGIKRYRVIPNFVDADAANYFSSHFVTRRRNRGDIIRFVFLSNLLPEKGIYEAIDAVSLLVESGTPATLDVVGGASGKVLHSFKQHISGLSFVRYRGQLMGEEKFKYLSESDIFLFPSRYAQEAFPLVIIEALAAGLIVIAARIGSIPDVIENKFDGLICDDTSSEGLYKLICYVLTLTEDEVCNIRCRAKIKSLEYSEDKFKSSLSNLFKEEAIV